MFSLHFLNLKKCLRGSFLNWRVLLAFIHIAKWQIFIIFFNTKSWFLLLIKFRMWHCRHRLWRALLRQHFQILSLTYHKCMSLTIKCSPGKSFFHAFYKHSPLYNFSSIKLIALKYYLILILRFMLCYWVALSQWCWCKLGASFPGSTSAYPEPQLDPLPGLVTLGAFHSVTIG